MFPDLTRDDVFRLETRRLWLRWPRRADAQAIVRFAGEKAVAEMTARIPHPLTIGDVESFVLRARRDNAEGTGLTLSITRKGNGAIGAVMFHALLKSSPRFQRSKSTGRFFIGSESRPAYSPSI